MHNSLACLNIDIRVFSTRRTLLQKRGTIKRNRSLRRARVCARARVTQILCGAGKTRPCEFLAPPLLGEIIRKISDITSRLIN